MKLHFNTTREERKKMVTAVEQVTRKKAVYLGAPTFAYKVADYTITKDGAIEWEDYLEGDPKEFEHSAFVLDACIEALGRTPEEYEEFEENAKEESEIKTRISIPEKEVNTENLINLLASKGALIKKALGIADIGFLIEEDKVTFPWFEKATAEEMNAYMNFVSAICRMTKEQKRISAKAKTEENEKYAFRCFLLRLGFIGDEYKQDRKILLKNLEGSSAFKTERKEA